MVSFAVQRLLSLIRSHLLTFDFSFITLRGGSKEIHCCDLWQSVLPVFSSNSCMESSLTYGSLIHWSLFLCVELKNDLFSFFFTCGCPVFPAPFAEETVFFLFYILASFVKD